MPHERRVFPLEEAADLYERCNWSLRELGEKYDLDPSAIGRIFKKHGIKVRSSTAWRTVEVKTVRLPHRATVDVVRSLNSQFTHPCG